jgi:hypothetical protein
MRSAEQGVVATASSDLAFASLERRLVGLRTEIDAILAELTSHRTAAATPLEAPRAEVTVETPIAEATDAEAAPAETPQAEVQPEVAGQISAEATASDGIEPIATVDPTEVEASQDLQADEASTPIASVADAQQLPQQIDPATQSLEATALEAVPATEPAAATGETVVATPAHAAVAETTPAPVIDLDARRRAKAASTTAPATRRGRRLATRIAASIIGLIAVAAALAIAERVAVESAQSLPWDLPLHETEPRSAKWSFFGKPARPDETGRAQDRSADDTPLARQDWVWPLMP